MRIAMSAKSTNRQKTCVRIAVLLQIVRLLLDSVPITLGQTTCNNGIGRVLYERLPNQQLQGFDDDVVRDTEPPFRVLEKCQDLCLRDRMASNNLVRVCTSFDFQPGSRIASFSGSAEYEESTCYLTREEPAPEGIGILMLVPNSVHFTEVCLTSSRPERECPSRRYVFERHPRKKLKLPLSDIKEITAANRSDCEDKCLNEFSFVCRSATYDSNMHSCTLSRFTRRTHPEMLEDDSNSDYLENTCLNAERRCDGLTVYVKEENKRLGGPFEVDIFHNMTLEECQSLCIRAEKYFCRSVEFDDQSKQCILSEEDSISQKDDLSISTSPTHNFYDLMCLDNQRGSEYPDDAVTSHLFASGRRPDTAFQRFRNSRLGGEFHSEITGRSLSECLDECLRQTSFQCRSAVYSDRFRTCRLSRYNQLDGLRIIYDADYDYYENLMLGGRDNAEDRERDRDRDHERNYDRNRPNGERIDYPSNNNHILRPVPKPQSQNAAGHPHKYGGFPEDDNTYQGRYSGQQFERGYSLRKYPVDNREYYLTIRNPSGQYDRMRPSEATDFRSPYSERHPFPRKQYQYDISSPRYSDRTSGQYLPTHGMDRNNLPHQSFGPEMFGPNRRMPESYDRYPAYIQNNFNRIPVSDYDRYPMNAYGAMHKVYGDAQDEENNLVYRPNTDRDLRNRGGGGNGDFNHVLNYHSSRYGTPYAASNIPSNRYNYGIGDTLGEPGTRSLAGGIRCDDTDTFKQMAVRQKVRRQYVRRVLPALTLVHCQRECIDAKDFLCRSFNYRDSAIAFDHETRIGSSRESVSETANCELSDRDTRDLNMPNVKMFDDDSYDYYERNIARHSLNEACLDVSQTCNEEGMEFTLRTSEGFYGRIYTHGFYDRCFFRGNGGTANILRISGPQADPECGTQRYGDTMTNIVVVQFAGNVQTGRDKRFNLTCIFRSQGEAVVSSGYIGAGSSSPIPIEYLPAENTLTSKVRLMILYQNRPTTTIAVGDPLTFRLETQDGYNQMTDIFATNVIARDPYSGRSIQLIDNYGCPLDSHVFPELDKMRSDDSLEAHFKAFKIPESNFLVFEATVRSCREGCQPAFCQGQKGRSEPSFGRRRRSANDDMNTIEYLNASTVPREILATADDSGISVVSGMSENENENTSNNGFFVQEMIEVFDSRDEIVSDSVPRQLSSHVEKTRSSQFQCCGNFGAFIYVLVMLVVCVPLAGIVYYRYRLKNKKNLDLDCNKVSSFTPSAVHLSGSKLLHEQFPNPRTDEHRSHNFHKASFLNNRLPNKVTNDYHSSTCRIYPMESIQNAPISVSNDPSEPIYTDASLFERSRSTLFNMI